MNPILVIGVLLIAAISLVALAKVLGPKKDK